MSGSWLLGNPVPLSDGLKDLAGDFLMVIQDSSLFYTNSNIGYQHDRHFKLGVISGSVIGTGPTVGREFHLTIVDASVISCVDPGGFTIGKLVDFQLHIVDTSHFLVTFKSVRFKLIISDTSIVYYRLSLYIPATANTNFAGDRFIDAIPDSLNFDPQIQSIGLVNDNTISTLTSFADRVRVLCDIKQQEEATLDRLAFQFNVLFYQGANLIADPQARIDLKRNLIAQSFGINCKLGTPGIIQRVISQIYAPAIMQEWWQYGGTHDHFRIYTESNINDPAVIASLAPALYSVIRASQAFDGYYSMIPPADVGLYISVTVYCEMDMVLPVITAT